MTKKDLSPDSRRRLRLTRTTVLSLGDLRQVQGGSHNGTIVLKSGGCVR
jgi:hypothetical protein